MVNEGPHELMNSDTKRYETFPGSLLNIDNVVVVVVVVLVGIISLKKKGWKKIFSTIYRRSWKIGIRKKKNYAMDISDSMTKIYKFEE